MVGKKGLRAVPLPTEAELEVLRVLWARGASTVREVFEALNGSKDVGYTTVLKQMQVMFEKGLLERAFAGSARDLVLGALGSKKVSAEELREIRKVLDQFERERRAEER